MSTRVIIILVFIVIIVSIIRKKRPVKFSNLIRLSGLLNQIKFRVHLLLKLFRSLSLPKSWSEVVSVSRILLKIYSFVIKNSFFLYLPLVFLFLIFPESKSLSILFFGLTYGYLFSIVYLSILLVLPSWGVILIDKIVKYSKK